MWDKFLNILLRCLGGKIFFLFLGLVGEGVWIKLIKDRVRGEKVKNFY